MKNLKTVASYLNTTLMIALLVVTMFSCSEDEKDGNPNGGENILEGSITEDLTLKSDKKYTLKGNVFITEGVTLTIEPGTIIFGEKSSKGALIIERGATIMADGTESEPIVFTSSAAIGNRNYGDWGGVVILGNAKNNKGTDVSI